MAAATGVTELILHLAWCADLTREVAVAGPPPTEAMLAAFWEYAAADVTVRMADEGRTDPRDLFRARDLDISPAIACPAIGADTLVHEVMHVLSVERLVGESVGSRLREHLLDAHTDVRRVGAVAAEAGVRRLVLSHFVPGDGSVADDTWRALAAVDFDGEVVVGRDLMRLAPPT